MPDRGESSRSREEVRYGGSPAHADFFISQTDSHCNLVVSPGSTDGLERGQFLEVQALFDNLLNLNAFKVDFSRAPTVTLLSPNINRFFKKVLFEVGSLVVLGSDFEILLEDNEFLTTFGLKSVMQEIFGVEFKHLNDSVTRLHGREYKTVRYSRANHSPFSETHTGWTLGLLCLNTSPEYLELLDESIGQARAMFPDENVEVLIFSSDGQDYAMRFSSAPARNLSTHDAASSLIGIKKNVISSEAAYSDIAVMHDRYLLSTTFFDPENWLGFRYGLTAVRVRLPSGRRGLDWAVVSSRNYVWSAGALASYRDYSDHIYVPGGFTVMRKSAWLANPWCESLAWNEHEDVELSRRYQRAGHVIGLARAQVTALRDRWIHMNGLLPFSDSIEYLPGSPIGEQRRAFLGPRGVES